VNLETGRSEERFSRPLVAPFVPPDRGIGLCLGRRSERKTDPPPTSSDSVPIEAKSQHSSPNPLPYRELPPITHPVRCCHFSPNRQDRRRSVSANPLHRSSYRMTRQPRSPGDFGETPSVFSIRFRSITRIGRSIRGSNRLCRFGHRRSF